MSDVNAYIFFDGNCAEAMKFYEVTLGGSVRMVKASETPGGSGDAIMHARLDLHGGGVLMASDWMDPNAPYPGKHGYRVFVSYPTIADAQRVCDALAEGGSVELPFQKTFWSEGFGMVTDKFGTPWMVQKE